MTEWLTAKESAKYIRLSYRIFLEQIRDGHIRSIKRGNRFMSKRQWLDDYMESLEVKFDEKED